MTCKYLKMGPVGRYICRLTHKGCTYQRYCTVEHRMVTDDCQKCPAFKPDTKDKK